MAGLLGAFTGGLIAIFLLYFVLEWLIFQRVFDDPVKGKLAAVAAAYVLALTVRGFTAADGGPWHPIGMMIYLPGALIVSIYAYRRGMKLRAQMQAEQQVADTFE